MARRKRRRGGGSIPRRLGIDWKNWSRGGVPKKLGANGQGAVPRRLGIDWKNWSRGGVPKKLGEDGQSAVPQRVIPSGEDGYIARATSMAVPSYFGAEGNDEVVERVLGDLQRDYDDGKDVSPEAGYRRARRAIRSLRRTRGPASAVEDDTPDTPEAQDDARRVGRVERAAGQEAVKTLGTQLGITTGLGGTGADFRSGWDAGPGGRPTEVYQRFGLISELATNDVQTTKPNLAVDSDEYAHAVVEAAKTYASNSTAELTAEAMAASRPPGLLQQAFARASEAKQQAELAVASRNPQDLAAYQRQQERSSGIRVTERSQQRAAQTSQRVAGTADRRARRTIEDQSRFLAASQRRYGVDVGKIRNQAELTQAMRGAAESELLAGNLKGMARDRAVEQYSRMSQDQRAAGLRARNIGAGAVTRMTQHLTQEGAAMKPGAGQMQMDRKQFDQGRDLSARIAGGGKLSKEQRTGLTALIAAGQERYGISTDSIRTEEQLIGAVGRIAEAEVLAQDAPEEQRNAIIAKSLKMSDADRAKAMKAKGYDGTDKQKMIADMTSTGQVLLDSYKAQQRTAVRSPGDAYESEGGYAEADVLGAWARMKGLAAGTMATITFDLGKEPVEPSRTAPKKKAEAPKQISADRIANVAGGIAEKAASGKPEVDENMGAIAPPGAPEPPAPATSTPPPSVPEPPAPATGVSEPATPADGPPSGDPALDRVTRQRAQHEAELDDVADHLTKPPEDKLVSERKESRTALGNDSTSVQVWGAANRTAADAAEASVNDVVNKALSVPDEPVEAYASVHPPASRAGRASGQSALGPPQSPTVEVAHGRSQDDTERILQELILAVAAHDEILKQATS